MSDVTLLRRAAKIARETAQAATDGPWGSQEYPGEYYTHQEVSNEDGAWVSTAEHSGNATHIALWHPGVASVIADWLDQHAAEHDTYDCQWERDACAALKTARSLTGEA